MQLPFEIVNFDEQGPGLRLCNLPDLNNRSHRLPSRLLCTVPRASTLLAMVGHRNPRPTLRTARPSNIRVDRLDDANDSSTNPNRARTLNAPNRYKP